MTDHKNFFDSIKALSLLCICIGLLKERLRQRQMNRGAGPFQGKPLGKLARVIGRRMIQIDIKELRHKQKIAVHI